MEWLTITEACKLLGLPNASTKRYMLNHPEYIQFKKVGNQYRINRGSLDNLKKIRKLYESGHQKDRVNEYMKASGASLNMVEAEIIEDVAEQEQAGSLPDNNNNAEILDAIQNLKEYFNMQLSKQAEQHQKEVTVLIQEIKKMQEAQQEQQKQILLEQVKDVQEEEAEAEAQEQEEETAEAHALQDAPKKASWASWFRKIFS